MSETTVPLATPMDPSAAPPRRLYTVNQILIATLLGSPLAGGFLLRRDLVELDQARRGNAVLGWSALATVALLALALGLPEHFPRVAIPMAYSFGMRAFAQQAVGEQVAAHLAAGGAKRSMWWVVLIGLAVCLIVVAGLGVLSLMANQADHAI